MARSLLRPLVVPALLLFTLLAGAAAGRLTARLPLEADAPAPRAAAAREASALTEEAIRLYAAGQFASACERFTQAVDEAPASPARRTDAGRCLERGGMQAMRTLLARLADGEGMAAAAPGVYGTSLAELEAQWRRHLGG